MKNLIDQSGLVTESDYLSLSGTLVLEKNYLIDTIVGARHMLHHKAVHVIYILDMPIPFKLWIQYARQQHVSESELLEVLLFLNSIGGLEINRSKIGSINNHLTQLKRLIMGLPRITRARRLSLDFLSTNRAVLLAMQPLFLASMATISLAFAVSMNIASTVYAMLIFLATLWISTVVHEQAHRYIITKYTQRKIIIQKGMRLGILHPTMPYRAEFTSALSGPLLGALAAILFCGALSLIFGNKELINAGLLIACFQFVSLLPFYGDGRAIWYKQKKGVYNVTK